MPLPSPKPSGSRVSMRITGVDFLLTFKCPSKCKHCSYRGGPERTGSLKLSDIKRYLREVTATQPLHSVGAHGGEPFLYFELLVQTMRNAKKLGVARTWVITNGFWAKNKTLAEERLTVLKEAGLKSITFSVDGFHREYVPFEDVKNGIEPALSVGFEKVWVDSYFLGSEDSNSFYNNLTKKTLRRLRNLGDIEINKREVDFEGRAAELLTKHVEPEQQTPTGRCLLPFWIGGTLRNPEVVEIDHEGNVTLCPGICIGNTKNRSLTRILQTYDSSTHPVLSIIAEEGPIGLLKVAKAKGFKEKKKFIDECHLCYEMRRLLRPYYPDHLSSSTCY